MGLMSLLARCTNAVAMGSPAAIVVAPSVDLAGDSSSGSIKRGGAEFLGWRRARHRRGCAEADTGAVATAVEASDGGDPDQDAFDGERRTTDWIKSTC